jgi:hypothetical protein
MRVFSVAYSADRSERENALVALRGLLELFAARPAFSYLAFTGSRQTLPSSAAALYGSGFAVLTSMLDRLRGELPGMEPPSTAARAAIGGGEALVRNEIVADRTEDLPRILPDLVYAATVGFLGQCDPLRLARQAWALNEETGWA